MHLYALLVAINDYPILPLAQCTNDAQKIKSYLKSLEGDHLTLHTLELLNEKATKANIQAGITDFLSQAGDEDVAFFYFSGHGAQEVTGGRFTDEHDGMLECLVSYYEKEQKSGFLLADKELRYLFSQLPNDPHLVSVFDSCHSGDIVRSATSKDLINNYQVKRMSGYFVARDYSEFIFHDQLPEDHVKTQPLSELIPFKNSVHLAACRDRELSWEDSQGGIFTRYLLTLLAATDSQISYQEIARWANISLKNITEKKQTPTISVQGGGKLTSVSPWLKLSSVHTAERGGVYAVHNQGKGWYLTIGSLRGIKEGTPVSLDVDGNMITLKVTDAEMDIALLEDPSAQGTQLDSSKRYHATLATTYAPLQLFINNIDGDEQTEEQIRQIALKNEHITLSDADNANFFLNIFNELVYISLPDEDFRPLVRQINLLDEPEVIENALHEQLHYLVKWNHYDTLVNPGVGFDNIPLQVELQIWQENDWIDITHDISYDLMPRAKRVNNPKLGNPWAQAFKMRITNISEDPLYVALLELQSDLGIASDSTGGQIIELAPGQTKLLFDQSGNVASMIFSDYKEVYNWKKDWTRIRFIFNNHKDLTIALQECLQPALETPLVISRFNPKSLALSKGQQLGNVFETFVKKWGTFQISLNLVNPEYNIISGDLLDLWDHYKKREEIAPFINQLYFEPDHDGFVTKTRSLPNRTGEDVNSKGLLLTVKKTIGNSLDNLRRRRKFKKARLTMTDKPVIVAEGDSWFLYPFLVKDILDYVMLEFPVLSLAAAGDELENYKADGELLETVAEVRPKFVLISGGGNDIIGPEIEHLLFEHIPAGKTPREYLNEKFDTNMAKLRELYEYFIAELKKHVSVKQLFIHGYDYIRVDHDDKIVSQGWVNRYMNEKGISLQEDRDRVIHYLVDSFNDILIELSKDDPFVTFIDLRGKVQQGQWYDEIHPDDVGYKTLGDCFIEAINTF
ncbi:MAG: caspase family protein [Saprospiraceae bacterium]|nr:caspase family protein [Lewinella sp.]